MKISLLTVLMAAAICAGCSSVNTAGRAQQQAKPDMVESAKIITDSGLDDYARIVSINESSVSGHLRVQVVLLNDTSWNREVNYKFEWFDQTGTVISDVTSTWIPITISAGEPYYLTGVSTSPKAKDFSVKISDKQR